jgi:hypothetical protein
MKRYIHLCLAGLIALLAFSACSSSGDSSPKQTIFFNLNNVSVLTTNGGSSSDFSFAAGDSLGLFLTGTSDETGLATTLLSNTSYGYNGSSWSLREPLGFYESQQGEQMKLYAYYPYSNTYTTTRYMRFQVNSDQTTQESLRSSDFLYASASCSVGSNPSIQMKHLMARIVVDITYASADIKKCTSLQLNAHPASVINLETEVNSTESAFTTLTGYLAPVSSGATKQQAIFILPAQLLSTNSPIVFDYGDKSFNVALNQQLESGFQYTLSFTSYGDNTMKYNGVQVDQWNQVEVKSGKLTVNENFGPDYTTGDVIVYQKGEAKNPVTIVVTGDGYTANDMARGGTFEQAAYQALDKLFSVEPFKTYRSYFSVYAIAAVSNESGSTNNTTGKKRDTYFGCSWSDDYSDMGVKSTTTLFNFVQQYCPDLKEGKTTLANTGVYVLVNDDRYGGITWSYQNGQNYAIIPTISGTLTWESDDPDNKYYKGDWTNVFLHECGGHAFGRLLDEYSYSGTYPYTTISGHSWSVPFGLNLTLDNNNEKGTVYWKYYLNNSDYPRVGFYEGGNGYPKGIWRSEVISGMCDNRPYFNAISRQLIVERIMSIAGETFSFNDFLKKDVNIDPVRDINGSGIKAQNWTLKEGEKVYPKLPSPKLIE